MSINDSERKRRGRIAEDAVCDLIRKRGYQIVNRNVTFAGIGEIDIIALRENQLIIIEVKARQSSSNFGGPLAAITRQKISRIIRTTYCYMKKNGLMNNYVMILAAGVSMNKHGDIESVEVVPVERL